VDERKIKLALTCLDHPCCLFPSSMWENVKKAGIDAKVSFRGIIKGKGNNVGSHC
jgi:hypothetical protein